MTAFRRLVLAALCAGLVSGALTAGAHLLATVPLILKAETYEEAAHHATSHEAAEWKPEDGVERTLYTVAADLMAAIGFALLLAAGLALSGAATGWRQGVLWGLAGFASFTLAPGLGLPPELPGSDAGPLVARQLWWLVTAAMTGGALALLAFRRRPAYLALAALLLVLPHLYGAPAGEGAADAAPAALTHQFVVAATLTSLLFWLALGATTAYFYRRFEAPAG
jgi:cobalt transporter subunit CbtA